MLATARFIAAASGNVAAFVHNADPHSTFVSIELPHILQHDKIRLINGIDKHTFVRQFAK